MRRRLDLSNPWSAVIVGAAAVALGVIAALRGPEPDADASVRAMAMIFHAVLLGALGFMAIRLPRLLAQGGMNPRLTIAALGFGILSCLGLLGRDFGII